MAHVHGYRKKNGTYVRSHYRKNPQRRAVPSTSSGGIDGFWIFLLIILVLAAIGSTYPLS